MNNNNATNQIQAHALTDKGRRPNNEDFVTFFEPTDLQERQNSGCIYIVADGVGGASVGERASQYAAEKVLYEYLQHPQIEPGKRLKQVLTRVNHEIFDYAENKGIRMATTMTVAVVLGNSLYAANVGDSRVYLIRGNEARQITQDHNMVGEMVRDGVMTEAEALRSKAKNRLTRSLGGEDEVHVDIFGPIPLQPNDKIMLCSDGLTRYALKEDIANLTASGSPKQITERLVNFAKERGRGGADNISVITVAYESSTALETTIRHPRPIAPEQPWEVLETNHDFKPEPSRPRIWKWIALLVSGLIGIILIGVTAITIVTWPSALGFLGLTTPTPTLKVVSPPPSPTPLLSLTTPSATPVTPSPPEVEQTTSEPKPVPSTFPGTVDCDSGVKIRPDPSINNDSPETLMKDTSINILGKIQTDNEDFENWYRIEYQSQNENYWWVWAVCIKLDDPTLEPQIPLLDPTGKPINNSPPQPAPSE